MQKVKRLLSCKLKRKREFSSACSCLRIDVACSCNPKWKAEEPGSLKETKPRCVMQIQVPGVCQGAKVCPAQPSTIAGAQPLAYSLCKEEVSDSLKGSRAQSGQSWAPAMALSDLSWHCRICKLMLLKLVWFWTLNIFFNNPYPGHEWKICSLLCWNSCSSYNWVTISLPVTCLYSWQ